MTSQADLADRYGTRSPRRRHLLIAAAVSVIAMATGVLLWVALFHGNPGATSGLVGYDVVDEHTVTTRVEVSVDGEQEAECLVRARSEDKSSVGEVSFAATGGTYELTIRTERRATAVELVGCRVEGQNLYR